MNNPFALDTSHHTTPDQVGRVHRNATNILNIDAACPGLCVTGVPQGFRGQSGRGSALSWTFSCLIPVLME